MAKEKLKFSIFELIYQNDHPSTDMLTKTLESQFVFKDAKFTYAVTTEVIDKYFWISVGYGAAQPRAPHLIDSSKENALVKNARTETQVEPNHQLFCIYNPSIGNIYISDSRKYGFVKTMLNNFSDNDFFIKRVIIDPEDFLRTLKIVDGMAIAAKTDLFTQIGSIFKPVQDIFGFGAPEQFYIKASYGVSLTEKIKNQFRFFNKEYKEGKLKKFTCIGRDNHGLETVFNADSLTRKIAIELDRPENGLYRSEDVRDEIVMQLAKNK